MSTYIYSKWLNNPNDVPHEFYSELDGFRNEVRKIEIFHDGSIGYASQSISTHGTMLGIEPVPSLSEIQSQWEFDTKEITREAFEDKWKEANKS